MASERIKEMTSFRCYLGFHRWRPVREFAGEYMIFGCECDRCGRRRLSLFGAKPKAPPPPRSQECIDNLRAVHSAQEWAAEVTGITPAAVNVWWT